MFDSTIEFFICFRYHIKSLLFFNVLMPIAGRVITPLPEKIPDKDADLQLVRYSSVIDTGKEVNAFLTNKFLNDEGWEYKLLYYIQSMSSPPPKTTYYRLKSSFETEQAFVSFLNRHKKTPRPLFTLDVLEPSVCIQNGPFFGNLVREGKYLVIDSLYMSKYKYKPDTLIPAVKAYFTIQTDNNIKLHSILYNDTIYKPEHPDFVLTKRLMYNYLLTRTILALHLVTCHLKISQIAAFGIRKYLSSNNTLKQFLWNFTSGVHGINMNTGSLIKRGFGSVSYFLPFSDDGIVDFINDSAQTDCSSYIFPQEPDYPCQILSECETVFDIYKKYVKRVIANLTEEHLDECIELYEYLRITIREFRHKSIEEVFASFMFTASVLHEITTHFFQQMVQGYDCPTSINSDGSIHKYRYLISMMTQIFVNIPQRKIFTTLPDSYNAYIRNQYTEMSRELLEQEFHCIDMSSVDSAVQK